MKLKESICFVVIAGMLLGPSQQALGRSRAGESLVRDGSSSKSMNIAQKINRTVQASTQIREAYGVFSYRSEESLKGRVNNKLVALDENGFERFELESTSVGPGAGLMLVVNESGDHFLFSFFSQGSLVYVLTQDGNNEKVLDFQYDRSKREVINTIFEAPEEHPVYMAISNAFIFVTDYRTNSNSAMEGGSGGDAVTGFIGWAQGFCGSSCVMCAFGSIAACKACLACGLAFLLCVAAYCLQNPFDPICEVYNIPPVGPTVAPGDPAPDQFPWVPPAIPGWDPGTITDCATSPTRFH